MDIRLKLSFHLLLRNKSAVFLENTTWFVRSTATHSLCFFIYSIHGLCALSLFFPHCSVQTVHSFPFPLTPNQSCRWLVPQSESSLFLLKANFSFLLSPSGLPGFWNVLGHIVESYLIIRYLHSTSGELGVKTNFARTGLFWRVLLSVLWNSNRTWITEEGFAKRHHYFMKHLAGESYRKKSVFCLKGLLMIF